jgi:hypothetical protein
MVILCRMNQKNVTGECGTSSILFQIIKWQSICKRKMPTYRSKSTKSCYFGTSRIFWRNGARWRHDLDARTHKVMTCSLSLSFSYWCETSLSISGMTWRLQVQSTGHRLRHPTQLTGNNVFDVASRETWWKFDVWRHDLCLSGAALRWSDVNYYNVTMVYVKLWYIMHACVAVSYVYRLHPLRNRPVVYFIHVIQAVLHSRVDLADPFHRRIDCSNLLCGRRVKPCLLVLKTPWWGSGLFEGFDPKYSFLIMLKLLKVFGTGKWWQWELNLGMGFGSRNLSKET